MGGWSAHPWVPGSKHSHLAAAVSPPQSPGTMSCGLPVRQLDPRGVESHLPQGRECLQGPVAGRLWVSTLCPQLSQGADLPLFRFAWLA